MGTPEYASMQEGELEPVARLLSHAFAGPRDGVLEWLKTGGLEDMRVVREGRGPVACLRRVPMGQFFGGRSVPMVGIAGVAVGPEVRGQGHAAWMMAEGMKEAKRDGFALSTLYASTQTLYRKIGYEQAGHRFGVVFPLGQLNVRERSAPITPLEAGDREAVRACYRSFAERFSGMLDRGQYVWSRVEKLRDMQAHGFGVRGQEGAIDGYLYLAQHRKDTGRYDVTVTDLAFNTMAAGRRLLGFLADFATVGDEASLAMGPHSPLLGLLPQQKYEVKLKDYWMLRIVDVRSALEQRGYSSGVTAEVHLDVRDDVLPENQRTWILSVEAGRGQVRQGGRGDVVIDIRALATAYAGLVPARALPLMGSVQAEPSALEALGSIFDGPTPWMTDFF